MSEEAKTLSPWWRIAVLLVMIAGFSLLSLVTVKTYAGAPPIPDRVVDTAGRVLFTGDDIRAGQGVFFKYGLMEHGTLWGHGAYLGPDYSAEYLHRLAEIGRDTLAQERFGKPFAQVPADAAPGLGERLKLMLRENRYAGGTLVFTAPEARAHEVQAGEWRDYFSGLDPAPGLPAGYIRNETELARLNDFFAWAAWATVATRPGTDYSYTNNWPYEPLVGNLPTLSLIHI